MRFADLKFVLPRLPETVVVVGDPGTDDDPLWRNDSTRVTPTGHEAAAGRVDLAVADPADLRAALDLSPRMLVVNGRTSPRLLRRQGLEPYGYIVRWGAAGPRAILPAEAVPLRYLLSVSRPRSAVRQIRNRLLQALLVVGVPAHWLVPRAAEYTVGLREPPLPALVGAARAVAGDIGGNWLLLLGDGDPLQRAVFLVFAEGSRTPTWAVKFGRSDQTREAFDRDERGLALAHAAGVTTASRAPRHIGRSTLGELPLSVESAAVGQPLHQFLAGTSSLRHRRQLVDAVAEWILAMNVETAESLTLRTPQESLAEIVSEADLAPQQAEDVLQRVRPLPGVLNHSDLGCWNIVTAGREFTVLDWESAWRPGPPLWDLAYFLADSLPRLHRRVPGRGAADTIRALFRGEHAESPRLFRWFRTAALALDLPPNSLGAVVLLSWCHHARSPAARRLRLARAGYGGRSAVPGESLTDWGQLARQWAVDPALGTHWSSWQ